MRKFTITLRDEVVKRLEMYCEVTGDPIEECISVCLGSYMMEKSDSQFSKWLAFLRENIYKERKESF